MRSPVPWRPGPAMATASSPLSLCGHWPSMQAFLEATAETRAAPRPLPSSDWMKVISQLGVSLRTMAWNRSLKLRGEAGLRSLLHGLSRASSAHPPETLPAERRVGATPGNPPLHPGLSGLGQSRWRLRPQLWPRDKRLRWGAALATPAHLGCNLYTDPSTPTVMRITSSLRLSRMRLMTPASPAPHMCAARVDTLSQALRTMSQSVAEGLSPSVLRIL